MNIYDTNTNEIAKRERMYEDIHTIKKWIKFWSIIILLPYILGVIFLISAFIVWIANGAMPLM